MACASTRFVYQDEAIHKKSVEKVNKAKISGSGNPKHTTVQEHAAG
jgi:hypothetical protein